MGVVWCGVVWYGVVKCGMVEVGRGILRERVREGRIRSTTSNGARKNSGSVDNSGTHSRNVSCVVEDTFRASFIAFSHCPRHRSPPKTYGPY
jgi:hypothetical protein